MSGSPDNAAEESDGDVTHVDVDVVVVVDVVLDFDLDLVLDLDHRMLGGEDQVMDHDQVEVEVEV